MQVKRFHKDDIGTLVFDTQRHCLGLYGFVGVYATAGLPIIGEDVKVAFQIPILYNGWNWLIPRSCMVSAHSETFAKLVATLRFTRPEVDGVEVTASHSEIISGGTMADHMNNNLANMTAANWASLASYENYGSFNPALLTGRYHVHTCSVAGRAVFYANFN